jgi:hypothetical protein
MEKRCSVEYLFFDMEFASGLLSFLFQLYRDDLAMPSCSENSRMDKLLCEKRFMMASFCSIECFVMVSHCRSVHIIKDDNYSDTEGLCAHTHKRKNWLFAVTEKGAKASANLYSLIETAKANNVEPSVYLKEVFTRLPAATCVEDIEALLPWNIAKVVV